MSKELKALEELIEGSGDALAKKILRVGTDGLSTAELKELNDHLNKELEEEMRKMKAQEIMR